MIGEFQLDGNIQNFIAIALVIALGIYVYLEFKKLKSELLEIKRKLNTNDTTPGEKVQQRASHQGESATQQVASHPAQTPYQTQHNQAQHNQAPTGLMSLFQTSQVRRPDPYPDPENPPEERSQSQNQDSEISTSDNIPQEEVEDSILELQKLMQSEEGILGEQQISGKNEIEQIEQIETTGGVETIEKTEGQNDDIKLISADSTESKYSAMTVSELKGILQERNLPLSGNKTKLIKRIQDNVIIRKVETSPPEQRDISG